MDIQSVVDQLRQEVRTIEAAIAARVGLGQTAPRRGRPPMLAQATAATPKRGPRKMSAAARARISAAQKARWRKQKAAATPKKAPPAGKRASGRKPMSSAQKKRLSEMMRKRWAERKRQK